MSSNEKEDSVVGQILVAVLIALIAGGTAPWWWETFFGDNMTSGHTPEPPENPPTSSPERSLNLYTQSLTNRDFSELGRIYPSGNQNSILQWLQGAGSKAPILTVQVVGQPQRIMTSADGQEIVLRATLQYCREDRSGSTDIKNYTFVKNQEIWHLDSRTAPEEVTPIRC